MVQSKVAPDVLIATYIKHRDELFIGNKVKPCTDKVFQILSTQLQMTPQAIRLSVVRKTNVILGAKVENRSKQIECDSPSENLGDASIAELTEPNMPTCHANYSIDSDDYALKFASQTVHRASAEEDTSYDEVFDDSNQLSECNEDEIVAADKRVQFNKNTVEFTVDVDPKDIFGVSYQIQGKKNRLKAAAGWGAKLRDIIWENFRSQCCWIFKSADPKVSGEITCKGGCNGCNAKIKIQLCPGESMQVKITDYDASIPHPATKCRITGAQKAHYVNLLKESSAHAVHTSEANRLMREGDPEPAHLPTLNALHIMQCRENSVGGRTTMTVFEALVELKSKVNPPVIGDISIYPFCVVYQLPMQKEFYKFATSRKRSVISIDATGFNMHTSSFMPSTDKMPIFLYTIACHSAEKTMPVFQMLSSRHSLSFLQSWMSGWGKESKKPDEIFLDDSAALIGACVQTFTRCHNTNEYISVCMNSLVRNGPAPKAFIRLDRSHFVKALHRLNILNKEEIRKKVLFKRVFGFLITCDDLDLIGSIVKDLFIVMKSPFVTPTCAQSVNDLQKLCERKSADDDDLVDFDETSDVADAPVSQSAVEEANQEYERISAILNSGDDSYKGTATYR